MNTVKYDILDSFTYAIGEYACEFSAEVKKSGDHKADEIGKLNDVLQQANIAVHQINEAFSHILDGLQNAHNCPPEYSTQFEKAEYHADEIIKTLGALTRYDTDDPLAARCFLQKLCTIRKALIDAVDYTVDLKDRIIETSSKEV